MERRGEPDHEQCHKAVILGAMPSDSLDGRKYGICSTTHAQKIKKNCNGTVEHRESVTLSWRRISRYPPFGQSGSHTDKSGPVQALH